MGEQSCWTLTGNVKPQARLDWALDFRLFFISRRICPPFFEIRTERKRCAAHLSSLLLLRHNTTSVSKGEDIGYSGRWTPSDSETAGNRSAGRWIPNQTEAGQTCRAISEVAQRRRAKFWRRIAWGSRPSTPAVGTHGSRQPGTAESP
jgi:hypothetical protein